LSDLSAVVVNYQGRDFIRDCLASFRGEDAELVVVDNASTDGSPEIVREEFPEAALVQLPRNVGFGAGVNAGLRGTSGRWVFLLNNDATVEPGALAELLTVGEGDERIGSVAAQIRFRARPDLINSAGIGVDRLGVAFDRLLGRPLTESESAPVEVFGASAGGALLRRSMLDELGGFDERFFLFLEDVDLAWRARMRGWRAMYAPAAVVHHHHSATARHGSAFKHYHVGRNRMRLLAKNADAAQLRHYGVAIAGYDVAQTIFVIAAGRTLAPLRGRLAGLREWRKVRRAAEEGRRPVELAPVGGLRQALRRNRAWALGSGSVAQQQRP
jgi:GT2 family glycosyltransferase